jgi:hypothetical protein
MKRSATAFICAAAAVLAAPATPALAYDFSLNLSGPTTGVAGQALVYEAYGVNPPPSEYWFSTWLDAVAIPTTVVSNCPLNQGDGTIMATRTGGLLVTISAREVVDDAGRFANIIGFTPPAPGKWLVCAYSDDGYTNTLARASVTVDVAPAAAAAPPAAAPPAPGGGAKPANTKAPRVTRSRGKLVCNPGRWSNKTGSYTYRWFVNGKERKGAAGKKKLRVTRRLRGRKVTCDVTATNGAGTTTVVSRPMRVG